MLGLSARGVPPRASSLMVLLEPGLHLVPSKTDKPLGQRLRRFRWRPNENGADSDGQNRRRSEGSGWLYASFWLEPGPDWDEEKAAEFMGMRR